MNGSIRVSAKTVDDAITEALIQLGVTSDRLEYLSLIHISEPTRRDGASRMPSSA